MEETAYIFTFDELRILLYSLGFTQCEGVRMPEKDFSAAEVIEGIRNLAAEGVAVPEEDGFRIAEDVARMLRVIGAPITTFSFEAGGAQYFCYVSDDAVVVSERYWERAEAVRLRMLDTAAFTAWREGLEDDHREGGSADPWGIV